MGLCDWLEACEEQIANRLPAITSCLGGTVTLSAMRPITYWTMACYLPTLTYLQELQRKRSILVNSSIDAFYVYDALFFTEEIFFHHCPTDRMVEILILLERCDSQVSIDLVEQSEAFSMFISRDPVDE